MVYWREVGLTYLRFSNIAAATVRKSIKADKRGDFTARAQSFIKNITKKSSN